MPDAPTRLALQTGELDDHRRDITPRDDHLWARACRCYLARHAGSAQDLDDIAILCERWPRKRQVGHAEALGVTVTLASRFAGRERVLRALTAHGVTTDEIWEPAPAAAAVESAAVTRPSFPYIFDPDSEQPAPIVPVLDGPRSPKVAELMEAIRQQDPTLAEAIVLGADLETLELLDGLSRNAARAERTQLSAVVDHDRAYWLRRAEGARTRQRLEGASYGWRGDSFPPECLEAARAQQRH